MTVHRLSVGADAVMALLPHRAPLLMVDRIEGMATGETPSLRARRAISANEPVFAGHFPGFSLWPGVYTIEGMGQTCQLLVTLLAVMNGFERAGLTIADALGVLRALDGPARMRGAAPSPHSEALVAALTDAPRGVSAAVDVRLVEPVFAGEVLEYSVKLTHAQGAVRRFDVEAAVDGRPAARGTLTAAILPAGRRAA